MWLLDRVDQHHPAPIHTCDFRAGREDLPHRSAVGSAARLWGHGLGVRFFSAITPLQAAGFGQPARVLLGELVGGRAGAPSPSLNASCSRLT